MTDSQAALAATMMVDMLVLAIKAIRRRFECAAVNKPEAKRRRSWLKSLKLRPPTGS
jgi:hypothetical protein